jgi:hypothetical protein
LEKEKEKNKKFNKKEIIVSEHSSAQPSQQNHPHVISLHFFFLTFGAIEAFVLEIQTQERADEDNSVNLCHQHRLDHFS